VNLLKWFSSGPEAAGKVLDAGISGIDKIFYTDEEKADARQKLGDSWIQLQTILTQETSVQAVTRRILSVLVVVPYVLMTIVACIAYPFSSGYSKFLMEVANGQFGWIVLAVVGFYFGPYMLGRMMDKKKV
jgi:hypothetical protein